MGTAGLPMKRPGGEERAAEVSEQERRTRQERRVEWVEWGPLDDIKRSELMFWAGESLLWLVFQKTVTYSLSKDMSPQTQWLKATHTHYVTVSVGRESGSS